MWLWQVRTSTSTARCGLDRCQSSLHGMQTRRHCLVHVALVSVALAACSVVSGRYLLDSDTSSTNTSSSQTLPTYAQCGGTGGNCAQFSSCSDSAYDGYICSAGDVSLRGADVYVCTSLAGVGCIYVNGQQWCTSVCAGLPAKQSKHAMCAILSCCILACNEAPLCC